MAKKSKKKSKSGAGKKKTAKRKPASMRGKKKSARKGKAPSIIRSKGGTEYRRHDDGNYYSPSGVLLAAAVLSVILSGESHSGYTPCHSDGSTFDHASDIGPHHSHDISPSSPDVSSSTDYGSQSDSSGGDFGGGGSDSGGGGGGGGSD